MNKISGIYKITNIITGDFYIGSSKDIKHRWIAHKSSSTFRQHPNSRLYQDISHYGIDNFTIEIIEETESLREREQYYIETLKPVYNTNRAYGLNIERAKEARRQCSKDWYNRLCFYNGETFTLVALSMKFMRQGIPHPVLEAKKYLLNNN